MTRIGAADRALLGLIGMGALGRRKQKQGKIIMDYLFLKQ
jgi:hypothetical protein